MAREPTSLEFRVPGIGDPVSPAPDRGLASRLWRADRPVRVARMMARNGTDLGALSRRPALAAVLVDAARACLACAQAERCRTWLDDPPAAGVPDFCPNRRRLAALPRLPPGPGGAG